MKNILDLLEELVSIDTTNDPVQGKKPNDNAPKLVRDVLDSWGIHSEIIESNGYYSVYGEIGKGRPVLMFLAHLDVVPAYPDEWNTDPFELIVKDDKAYGRGSTDDKGNVAAIMFALKELSKTIARGKVLFAFTCDEEIGGINGARVIAEKLRNENLLPKYLINGDGSGMRPIIRRRKGFKVIIESPEKRIKVRGRQLKIEFEVRTPVIPTRHSAYFMPGVDTHPMIAVSHFLRGNPEYTAVSIEGLFIKSNVIPPKVTLEYVDPNGDEEIEADYGLTELMKALVPLVRCPIPVKKHSDYGISIMPNVYMKRNGKHVLEIDIRAMTDDKNLIREALSRAISFISSIVSIRDIRTGPGKYLFTPPDAVLPQTAIEVLKDIGIKAEPVEAAGASDSRYFTPFGVECIDFGPIGGNIHGPNEWIDVKSLKVLPKFYAEVARRLIIIEERKHC